MIEFSTFNVITAITMGSVGMGMTLKYIQKNKNESTDNKQKYDMKTRLKNELFKKAYYLYDFILDIRYETNRFTKKIRSFLSKYNNNNIHGENNGNYEINGNKTKENWHIDKILFKSDDLNLSFSVRPHSNSEKSIRSILDIIFDKNKVNASSVTYNSVEIHYYMENNVYILPISPQNIENNEIVYPPYDISSEINPVKMEFSNIHIICDKDNIEIDRDDRDNEDIVDINENTKLMNLVKKYAGPYGDFYRNTNYKVNTSKFDFLSEENKIKFVNIFDEEHVFYYGEHIKIDSIYY